MPPRTELSPDALRAFHQVTCEADDALEACIRDRLPLGATVGRWLPLFERWMGAKAARLYARDEHLQEARFVWGEASALPPERQAAGEGFTRTAGGDTLLWQDLDLAGVKVGRAEVLLPGDRTTEIERLQLMLDAACEELDGILATVHAAGHKQRLILHVSEALADPVFERGVDRAVELLHQEIGLPHFALLYRDAVDPGTCHYRIYEQGRPRFESEHAHHPALEAALAKGCEALLDPREPLFRKALGLEGGVETVLSSGLLRSEHLGKVVCAGGPTGLSTFGLDVVDVLCRAVSQRLVDFNRERRHLAQFFAPRVTSELLRDPAYRERHLAPRTETVAVLYADINSFTKISEQVLEGPEQVGRFVDRWSAGAVQLLFEHGGVFDKMVGDCIIGLFGPPFFREDAAGRALRALRAARAISRFTADMEKEPPYDRVPGSGIVPGLGVAIGLNLCPMSVGLYGPNQDFTGFSPGMNNTARLQALAGYRESLAMDSFVEALAQSDDPLCKGLSQGEWLETPVKNVKRPLRYRKLSFPDEDSP